MAEVIQTGRNTVGKGEIAHYEQFLLFPQCFQEACFPGAAKSVIVWEWVKALSDNRKMNWTSVNLSAPQNEDF